jgi:hypothetical protein
MDESSLKEQERVIEEPDGFHGLQTGKLQMFNCVEEDPPPLLIEDN